MQTNNIVQMQMYIVLVHKQLQCYYVPCTSMYKVPCTRYEYIVHIVRVRCTKDLGVHNSTQYVCTMCTYQGTCTLYYVRVVIVLYIHRLQHTYTHSIDYIYISYIYIQVQVDQYYRYTCVQVCMYVQASCALPRMPRCTCAQYSRHSCARDPWRSIAAYFISRID